MLVRIEPYMSKEDTHLCESVSPGVRFEAALPFWQLFLVPWARYYPVKCLSQNAASQFI